MSRTSTTSASTTQIMRCGSLRVLKSTLLSQVILWLERNDSISQLSSTVERRDVSAVINASENEAIFRQISRVVIKADLLRYEVLVLKERASIKIVPGFVQIWGNLHRCGHNKHPTSGASSEEQLCWL